MKKQQKLVLFLTLGLIAATAGLLVQLRARQKLGRPAVKIEPISGLNAKVILPEQVLDYVSKELEQSKIVTDYLPKDTSFGQRMYRAPDGFSVQVNVVLMGRDRTSLHKPQFCLGSQGWSINPNASTEATVSLTRPRPYELPVMKLITSQQIEHEGRSIRRSGVYVYWFVAEDEYTPRHTQRMWWMARDLLTRGVLQRWAYISYFAACLPGEEEATFERMKGLIAASVPEFQTTPRAESPGVTALK